MCEDNNRDVEVSELDDGAYLARTRAWLEDFDRDLAYWRARARQTDREVALLRPKFERLIAKLRQLAS